MSRIYFSSPSGEAELWGGERAHIGRLCSDVAIGILSIQDHHERVHELAPDRPGYFPYSRAFSAFQQWCVSMETALHLCWDDEQAVLAWRGQRINLFDLVLNTAARAGGNPLKLAARLHGQCEIHAWVAGEHRAWLAGIIREGRESGLFRDVLAITGPPLQPGWEAGTWESVAKLLDSRDDEPVVTSYSVCDSFLSTASGAWQAPPAAALPRPEWVSESDWDPEGNGDHYLHGRDEAWERLPDAERWRVGMEWLQSLGGGRQLKPDDWDTFWFGQNLTVMDLLAHDYADRLNKALGFT